MQRLNLDQLNTDNNAVLKQLIESQTLKDSALPSDVVKSSDISDMETTTHASSTYATKTEVSEDLQGKQDLITSNDPLPASLVSGLAGVATSGSYDDLSDKPAIPAAQVQSDWTQSDNSQADYIRNKPSLAAVATTGSYTDLTDKPTIPAAQVQSDWTQSNNAEPDFIKNKPSLATVATTGAYSDLTGTPSIPAAQVQSDWGQTDSSQIDFIKNKPSLATVATTGAYSDLSGTPSIPSVDQTYSGTSANAQSGIAVKSAIDAAVSAVYKAAGTVAFSSLPTPGASYEGNVYNISDAFTTDNRFVEGSGVSYPAGTNVAVIDTGSSIYKFDVLSGFVDLSGYQQTATAVTHTASTAAGSATQPVYVAADGTATPTTYSLEKSVPADAVFTDTTYSVFTGADGTNAGTPGLVKAPAATDNTKFLCGNGNWETVQSGDPLPPQAGNSGKFLTTNGTSASWSAITGVLPSQSGNSGKFLTTDGTDASWASVATVATTGSYTDLSNKPTIPEAQIQSDWTQSDNTKADYIKNKPSLATVATTGSYTDLSNTPTIPAAQVQSDWSQSDNTQADFIKNKPSLATVATTGAYSDLSGTPTIPAAQIQSDWSQTDNSALDYIKNKPSLAAVATSGSYTDLSDKPTIPAAQIQSDWAQTTTTAADYIKNKPSLATVATTGAYTDLSGTPSIPTKTSDLTNDSGFITSSSIPVATTSTPGIVQPDGITLDIVNNLLTVTGGGGGGSEFLIPQLYYHTGITGTEMSCPEAAGKDRVLIFKNGVLLRPDEEDDSSDSSDDYLNDYMLYNNTVYFTTSLAATDLITVYTFAAVSSKTYTAGTAVDLTGDAISVKTDNSTVTVNQSGQLQSVMSETSTLDQVLVPNTVYKLGTVSSVTASVGTASNKEIIIYFTADTGISVTLTGVTWLNGNTISPESGSSYVISILNNIAVWGTY